MDIDVNIVYSCTHRLLHKAFDEKHEKYTTALEETDTLNDRQKRALSGTQAWETINIKRK
jgi:hypothetical protein